MAGGPFFAPPCTCLHTYGDYTVCMVQMIKFRSSIFSLSTAVMIYDIALPCFVNVHYVVPSFFCVV